jgi:hypothetical protein
MRMPEPLRWVVRLLAVVLLAFAAFMSLGMLLSSRGDAPFFTLIMLSILVHAPCFCAWRLLLKSESDAPPETEQLMGQLSWAIPFCCWAVTIAGLRGPLKGLALLAGVAAFVWRTKGYGLGRFLPPPKPASRGKKERALEPSQPAAPLDQRLKRAAVFLFVEVPDALMGKKG